MPQTATSENNPAETLDLELMLVPHVMAKCDFVYKMIRFNGDQVDSVLII